MDSATAPEAFLCHPALYHADADHNFASRDGEAFTHVRNVQAAALGAAVLDYPNKATSWLQAHTLRICGVNLGVRHGDALHVIDVLAQLDGTPLGSRDAADYVAAFVFFGDGSRRALCAAKEFVSVTRAVCEKRYGFLPQFRLLHLTPSGRLMHSVF